MGKIKKESFRKKKIRVSVRWNPGIGIGFHPRVITAGKRSSDGTPIKFGVEEKKVLPVFAEARRLGFTPVGLHQHLGSGWVADDFEMVVDAVERMIRMARVLARSGFDLEFLDFGGGFGPRYSDKQSLFPLNRYVKAVFQKTADAKLSVGAVILEPGKYLVGNAGAVLLRVEYVKESYGNLFVCVNGGTYNTVPRPAIYLQAHHEIVNGSRIRGQRRKKVTIAGNLCETGDVFGKERLIPVPESGDIIAVLHTGAYCMSMASEFNLREIPREILI
jgi:diaminopimelate decarboxylase